MTPERKMQAEQFLAAAGWRGASIAPLAADASFRHYHRVQIEGVTAVLMDAPPDKEDCTPFVAVDSYLRNCALHAPEIYRAELKNGLLLLEDFGDERLSIALRRDPQMEFELYRQALDILNTLHVDTPPSKLVYSTLDGHGEVMLQAYDDDVLSREVALFHEWYTPAAAIELSSEAISQYHALWRTLWQVVLQQTLAAPVMTLRDYHADNLMLLNGDRQTPSLGLIDFQDALAGHPAYDLASLLQDIRYTVSQRLEQEMLSLYLANRPKYIQIYSDEAFLAAYHILGAQRLTKIIGIFTRLSRRDGKHHYLNFMPRLWHLLERQLHEPVLAPIAEWFEFFVPSVKRQLVKP